MITIVTGNNTKFAEMQEALSHHGIAVEQRSVAIDEIQSLNPEEVIRAKALQAFSVLHTPVLVDDSGITFEQYPHFPGTYSKFAYQALGFAGLYQLTAPGEKATFLCSVAYMEEGMDAPHIFWGKYHGIIMERPEHDSGREEMPYAHIFQPDGETQAMAEMTSVQRAQDHRHQALNAFAQWYNTQRL